MSFRGTKGPVPPTTPTFRPGTPPVLGPHGPEGLVLNPKPHSTVFPRGIQTLTPHLHPVCTSQVGSLLCPPHAPLQPCTRSCVRLTSLLLAAKKNMAPTPLSPVGSIHMVTNTPHSLGKTRWIWEEGTWMHGREIGKKPKIDQASKPHFTLHPGISKMFYWNNSPSPCQPWGRGGTRR